MKKIKVKLCSLNKIGETFIDERVDAARGILKVTTETFYETYEHSELQLKNLAKEWFEKYGHSAHAYRDGSKLPWVNLLKVEIIKRKQTRFK